jgi:hypothetical protein
VSSAVLVYQGGVEKGALWSSAHGGSMAPILPIHPEDNARRVTATIAKNATLRSKDRFLGVRQINKGNS